MRAVSSETLFFLQGRRRVLQSPPGTTFFRVAGRLRKIAPAAERRGHVASARAADLSLTSSTTDGSGRFLLEWRGDMPDDGISIELLDLRGNVSESARLTAADLVSPPVVEFSGDGVVGFGRPSEGVDPGDTFEAEGDHPLCVTSSCLDAALTWTSSQGSRISIFSDGEAVREGLPHRGSLSVIEDSSRRYTLRIWPAGAGPDGFSERTVEVRRYPSLSLVLDGDTFKAHSWTEFGAATSCAAGEEGLTVRVTSSDLEMVPEFELAIPVGSRWASTRVYLGEKTGPVEVTASAQGYTRDAVTFALES
jgi:hypothetical protein